MPAFVDTEETERHPSEFQGLFHTRCCSPFAHPSFLNSPVNMDYFHVKKQDSPKGHEINPETGGTSS